MNRKPQPADSWWSSHQASCNGTFIKISEPKEKEKEKESSKTPFKGKGRTWSGPSNVADFFKKVKVKDEPNLTKLKCVNCSGFETESLQELNNHLDSCLSPSNVIDLT